MQSWKFFDSSTVLVLQSLLTQNILRWQPKTKIILLLPFSKKVFPKWVKKILNQFLIYRSSLFPSEIVLYFGFWLCLWRIYATSRNVVFYLWTSDRQRKIKKKECYFSSLCCRIMASCCQREPKVKARQNWNWCLCFHIARNL